MTSEGLNSGQGEFVFIICDAYRKKSKISFWSLSLTVYFNFQFLTNEQNNQKMIKIIAEFSS